jgi:hypothetical protein
VFAQTVVETSESLPMTRPEAWAMAWMSQGTAFQGFGPATARRPGALAIGGELGQLPHISSARRRVGFDGTKPEDLNKSPVFGRVRAWVGLPAGFTLELGWTPPLSIGGARAHRMVAVALERPLWRHGDWMGGIRFAHRRGEVRGDITCSRTVAAEPPGSSENPFGCRAPSHDRFRERADSVELTTALALAGGRLHPFASITGTRLRVATQVDAEVFGVVDRSRLHARDTIGSAAAGVMVDAGAGWEWTLGLQWTPLDVRRQGQLHAQSDDLWSLRFMLRRSLR